MGCTRKEDDRPISGKHEVVGVSLQVWHGRELCSIHRRTGRPSLCAYPADGIAFARVAIEDKVPLLEDAARGYIICKEHPFSAGIQLYPVSGGDALTGNALTVREPVLVKRVLRWTNPLAVTCRDEAFVAHQHPIFRQLPRNAITYFEVVFVDREVLCHAALRADCQTCMGDIRDECPHISSKRNSDRNRVGRFIDHTARCRAGKTERRDKRTRLPLLEGC
jgi:hypothetical protein